MAESRREEERSTMSTKRRVCLFLIRTCVWMFVIGVIGASFYLIVMVVSEWVPQVRRLNTLYIYITSAAR